MANGFPVIGAIGFACIILLGFVLLIRYALRSEKNAHKECAGNAKSLLLEEKVAELARPDEVLE